jgi:hypothetical protein
MIVRCLTVLVAILVAVTQSASAYMGWLNVPSYITLKTRVIGHEVSLSSDTPLITMAEESPSFAKFHSTFQFFAVQRDSAIELPLWSIVCHVRPLSAGPAEDQWD